MLGELAAAVLERALQAELGRAPGVWQAARPLDMISGTSQGPRWMYGAHNWGLVGSSRYRTFMA